MSQFAISALKDKRARLAGELIEARKRIADLQADIKTLDAALKIFGHATEVKPIKPRTVLFARNELKRLIIAIMRENPDLKSNREIAEEIIRRKDWEMTPDFIRNIQNRVKDCRKMWPKSAYRVGGG